MIDWAAFTPGPALAGGLLVGLGAVLLMALNGRIAGISGILAGALHGPQQETRWRRAFVLGMLVAVALFLLLAGVEPVDIVPALPESSARLLLAGALVGVGTALGAGCTSGHGVCGLSRLSLRSLLAVVVFMGVAMLVVAVLGRAL